MRRSIWIIYLAVVAAVAAAYVAGPLDTGPVFNVVGASAVVAIVVGARTNAAKGARLPWYCFAFGQAMFVAGDVLAYNYTRLFGGELPFPSVADPLYLAVYPSLVAGLLLMVRRRSPGRDRASLIDALIITIGVGTLSWVFLMAPYVHDGTLGLATKLVSLAYPLMDLMLLGVVARLAAGAGGRDTTFRLLALGITALLLTDAIYGWLQLHGIFETGGWLDAGWMGFYALLGAAALHPSMGRVSEPVAEPDARLTGRRLLVLAGAMLVTPAILAARAVLGHASDQVVLAAASILLCGLVMARMAGIVRRHEAAARREAALRYAGEALVGAAEAERIYAVALDAARRVVGTDCDVRLYRVDDQTTLRVVAATDVDPATEPDMPLAELGVDLQARRGPVGGIAVADHREAGGFATNRRTASLASLFVRDELAGVLAVDTPQGLATAEREGLAALAAQVALALESAALTDDLSHQAFHDPVTGLPNRALFRDRVAHAIARQRRREDELAVLFLDLDDFKTINDSLGHAAGDELLRVVGERLHGAVRASDTAARFGGDEFAVLLESTGGTVEAAEVAERILTALAAPIPLDGRDVFVHASLGITMCDDSSWGPSGADNLLRNADVAMYMAKEGGKNRYQLFEPAMHAAAIARLELKADLQRAVAEDQLVVHYQPIVDLNTGQMTGVEALMRWEHPERGLIMPGDFIPVAEDTGVIVELGRKVLEEACLQAARLQAQCPREVPLTMSVNLSARQLQAHGIVDQVREALDASGIPPSSLVLELTESVMMDDTDLAIMRLHELRALGVRLAIDDFGTGYSSLNYIRQFPLDILKVDRSFVLDINDGGEVAALTEAIIGLARILNLRAVAEGIEDGDQMQRLVELRCDLGQGYHLHRPMPADAIEALAASQALTVG
jgi:diguanylate cyclase (GGDEF)-like protein